ncbi:MAG: vWA domain-containing protein [Planctomycetota bacterium]
MTHPHHFSGRTGGLKTRALQAAPEGRLVQVDPQESGDRDLGPGADDEPLGCIVLPPRRPDPRGEDYARLRDNPFRLVRYGHDSSTFSTDVDTASYSNLRRFLQQHQQLPPRDAVRIEEMINYFDYGYVDPADGRPFALRPDLMACPWADGHLLLRVGIQGHRLDTDRRPPSTLVFLIDVSGSMDQPNKLPLLKKTFGVLVDQLDARDRVAIVTYAGRAGVALEPTAGDEKRRIMRAIDGLGAGGSTAGADGIGEAYRLARSLQEPERQARVILATDGDFNVGITDHEQLVQLVRQQAEGGVFLNVLGFGSGNYQDARMETLSNDGNGIYAYIDGPREARKVFEEDLLGNLVTLGKDVKIQLFFNPARVRAWRLIGYANRLLQQEDFNDDSVDAGEVGAGHQVTALYEIIPVGSDLPRTVADPNPFVEERVAPSTLADAHPEVIARLRLRYKPADGTRSILIEEDATDALLQEDEGDATTWAACMAGFGMLLRGSGYAGDLDWTGLIEQARSLRGRDPSGHRAEAIRLMEIARDL